jgi:hypothetical protein
MTSDDGDGRDVFSSSLEEVTSGVKSLQERRAKARPLQSSQGGGCRRLGR